MFFTYKYTITWTIRINLDMLLGKNNRNRPIKMLLSESVNKQKIV